MIDDWLWDWWKTSSEVSPDFPTQAMEYWEGKYEPIEDEL